MKSARPSLSVLAAVMFVALNARADDFEANVDIDLGGMGFGVKVDIKDPGQPAGAHHGKRKKTASSREEITSDAPGEHFKLVYEDHPHGKTEFKVLEPEGFGLRVTESNWTVKQDSIPTSFSAKAGKFHRFEVFHGKHLVFDKKFEAKQGKVATLWVYPSAAPAPVVAVAVSAPVVAEAPASVGGCMDDGELGSIVEAIESEGFEEEKLGVLDSALADRVLCGAQVKTILELYGFSSGKLGALKLMAPRISDPRNNFKIIESFSFSSDKEQARKILK